jgi:hypothetical protein
MIGNRPSERALFGHKVFVEQTCHKAGLRLKVRNRGEPIRADKTYGVISHTFQQKNQDRHCFRNIFTQSERNFRDAMRFEGMFHVEHLHKSFTINNNDSVVGGRDHHRHYDTLDTHFALNRKNRLKMIKNYIKTGQKCGPYAGQTRPMGRHHHRILFLCTLRFAA